MPTINTAFPGLSIDSKGSQASMDALATLPKLSAQPLSSVLPKPQGYVQPTAPAIPRPQAPAAPLAPVAPALPQGFSSSDPAVLAKIAEMQAQAEKKPLEAKPGVFSSSSLKDFYDKRMELGMADYKAAQDAFAKSSQAVSMFAAPDYAKSYQEAYAAKAVPLDAQIQAKASDIAKVDAALRAIEDDTRAEIGGRASESVIMAEVARRSKPLQLQKQTLQQEGQNLLDQRKTELESIQTAIGYEKSAFEGQLGLAKEQAAIAKTAVDQFNSLMEKGAAASDKDVDNFRQAFSTLLTNAPDALRTATEDELAQLRTGFIPASLMRKIGSTVAEQKLAQGASAQQVLSRAAQIQATASQQGLMMTAEEAIRQAQAEYASLGSGAAPSSGAPTGEGSIAYRTNNPGNIKWGSFAKSLGAVDSGIKAADGGTFAMFPSYEAGRNAQVSLLKAPSYASLTVEQAMRRWSNNGYGADVVGGAIAGNRRMSSLSPAELSMLADAMQEREGYYGPSKTETPAPSSKFTPEFYATALGQKVLDNEMQARARFESNPIVKEYVTIQDNLETMKGIVGYGVRGPADLALVYSFMKALDPGSVVREAEYDAAAKSGNIFSGWAAKFNGYLTEGGGQLPPEVRKAFVDLAESRLKAKAKQYDNYAKRTRDIVDKQNMNPDNVVIDFSAPSLAGDAYGYEEGADYSI